METRPPAITAPTTQRAWRALQVHHMDGPVRDASSKGGVEGAKLGPPLPAGRAPMGRASHRAPRGAARSAPESRDEASASSTMPTSSSHRSQHPSLAHLVASLGHGGAKIYMLKDCASRQEQPKTICKLRNARAYLQRPSWWLSRGPVRRCEVEKRPFLAEERTLRDDILYASDRDLPRDPG